MIKYLVLDTNILYKDYDFRSNDLRKLIKLCSLYQVKVCIPQIVIDECLGQYRKEFKKALDSFNTSCNNISRILGDKYINKFPVEDFKKFVTQRESLYPAAFKKFIEDKSIEVMPYCDISHQDIVNRMYNSKHPFPDKDMEVGYKDYLIVKSVLEHIKDNDAIIYTKNIKDFSKDLNDKEINKLHPDYDAANCLVSSSLPSIIQKLYDGNTSFRAYKLDNKELEDFIDKITASMIDDILFKHDLYGELSFEPEIYRDTIYSQLVNDPTIEHDDDLNTFTISGKIKIQFYCKFQMNNYEFDLYDDEFYFHKLVSDLINKKDRKPDSEWQYIFHDVFYSGIFEFNYDLFDAPKKPLSEYDEHALSIYRAE